MVSRKSEGGSARDGHLFFGRSILEPEDNGPGGGRRVKGVAAKE